MPGILPMKVIKVGSSAQSRIAQACDRCRSKKIRCDGVRPCCTQCANVGFECKTSDKLSRRAFPRGYTESLEERVRGLELEVRELKDLLDEKDEKIDLLSRIHSQSSQPLQRPSPRRKSASSIESDKSSASDKDEVLRVQQSPHLLAGEGAESYFQGTSSSRNLVEAFKHRLQEAGRSSDDIDTQALLDFKDQGPHDSAPAATRPESFEAPPRLVSDQLINIFFQEWAPLFPVLHRPTFLGLYERYVTDTEAVTDPAEIAQLYLVFSIAAISSASHPIAERARLETRAKAAIEVIMTNKCMAALQVLVLAQIFYAQQGDLDKLLAYKALATSLSARLGLHQSQKMFGLGTLTCETRKKVFWSLYTVDCFTAVILGLPKHIKDDDVECEYPVDADDEYVTERGFLPTLPGESTKLSSALALFRAARILSRVLERVFPAKATYELSLRELAELQDELDAWCSALAPHLRLQFVQDKPSTGTISSRSPLLSLTYHYIRALIHRPVVYGSASSQHSPALISHANSCKHIVQLVELLEERGMSFAFCCNKSELLVSCGFGLLFQGLDLDQSSKIFQDDQRMIKSVNGLLRRGNAACAPEFSRIAAIFLPDSPGAEDGRAFLEDGQECLSRQSSNSSFTITPHPSLPSSTKRQLKAIASRFAANGKTPGLNNSNGSRRPTMPNLGLQPAVLPKDIPPSNPQSSPSSHAHSEPTRSPTNMGSVSSPAVSKRSSELVSKAKHLQAQSLNLDYLSFGSDSDTKSSQGHSVKSTKVKPQHTDWERLLGSLDNGPTNIYDACYGGQPVAALVDSPLSSIGHSHSVSSIGSDSTWNTTADIWAQLCQGDSRNMTNQAFAAASTGPDRVLSLSSVGDFSAGRSGSEELTLDPEWAETTGAVEADGFRRSAITTPLELDDMTFSTWDSVLVL